MAATSQIEELPLHMIDHILHNLKLTESANYRAASRTCRSHMPGPDLRLARYTVSFSRVATELCVKKWGDTYYQLIGKPAFEIDGQLPCSLNNALLHDNFKAVQALFSIFPNVDVNSMDVLQQVISVDMFLLLQREHGLNIQSQLIDLYLHHTSQPGDDTDSDYDSDYEITQDVLTEQLQCAHRIFKIMCAAGADVHEAVSQKIIDNDVEAIEKILACRYFDGVQYGADLVSVLNDISVVVHTNSEEMVDTLCEGGVYVVHILLRDQSENKCAKVVTEDEIMDALQRLFNLPIDKNEEDEFNKTILETLYERRPLNRRILQFFNNWPHDQYMFF
jgi:hypothetical protein